jgi:hypothetical protein
MHVIDAASSEMVESHWLRLLERFRQHPQQEGVHEARIEPVAGNVEAQQVQPFGSVSAELKVQGSVKLGPATSDVDHNLRLPYTKQQGVGHYQRLSHGLHGHSAEALAFANLLLCHEPKQSCCRLRKFI